MVRSCNDYCSRKAISITYSECVFVALVIQHAMRISHIVICGLSDSKIFLQIISQTARFSWKKVIEHKMCVLTLFTSLSETLFILRWTDGDMIKMYIGLHVKAAVPLQAWSGPEGSRKLRFPYFMTTAQDGGKVLSLTTHQLKGKAVPLQTWSVPEGSRKLRFPYFMNTA